MIVSTCLWRTSEDLQSSMLLSPIPHTQTGRSSSGPLPSFLRSVPPPPTPSLMPSPPPPSPLPSKTPPSPLMNYQHLHRQSLHHDFPLTLYPINFSTAVPISNIVTLPSATICILHNSAIPSLSLTPTHLLMPNLPPPSLALPSLSPPFIDKDIVKNSCCPRLLRTSSCPPL